MMRFGIMYAGGEGTALIKGARKLASFLLNFYPNRKKIVRSG